MAGGTGLRCQRPPILFSSFTLALPSLYAIVSSSFNCISSLHPSLLFPSSFKMVLNTVLSLHKCNDFPKWFLLLNLSSHCSSFSLSLSFHQPLLLPRPFHLFSSTLAHTLKPLPHSSHNRSCHCTHTAHNYTLSAEGGPEL